MQQHTKNRNSERTQSPAVLGRKSLLACALMSLLASNTVWAEIQSDGAFADPNATQIIIDGITTTNPTAPSGSVSLDGGSGEIMVNNINGTATTITGGAIDTGSIEADSVVIKGTTNTTIDSNWLDQNNAMRAGTQSSINYLDQRINHLDRRIDDVAERAYGGIASVAALAAIPAPAAGKTFSVGVGAGNYSSENALAIGFRAALTESMSVTAGVSRNTASKTVSNMGVGYSW